MESTHQNLSSIVRPPALNRISPESSAVLFAILCASQNVSADAYDDFQLRRLLSPTENQYVAEAKGKVYIYDGMNSSQVDIAMDDHFDRIDSMMFTRIVHTSTNGEYYVENDGCD